MWKRLTRGKGRRVPVSTFKRQSIIEPIERRMLLSVFFDDFNRPDSSTVGNGWLNTANNVGGNLVIRGNEVSAPGPDGAAGIYRPFPFAAPVTISATLKEENGFGGILRRYTSDLSIANDGTLSRGYGLNFSRGDQNYPSGISLFDGNTTVASITPSFEFGPAISTTFTISPDGSVQGSVSQGTEVFNFSFGPHAIQSTGSDFSYVTGFADGRSGTITNPRLDDLRLETVDADSSPPTGTLEDPGIGGSISKKLINDRGYIDVDFSDVGGSGIDEPSITDAAPEFTLNGTAASGVSFSGMPTHIDGSIYRYTFTGNFGRGPVTVNFAAGAWGDNAGNTNLAVSQIFSIVRAEEPTNRMLTGTISGDNAGIAGLRSDIHVSLTRADSDFVQPNAPTWLVIHGRESNAVNMLRLADAIQKSGKGQVLVLDWSEGSTDNEPHWLGLQGARWIPRVASWVEYALNKLHIKSSQLNLVGHSWGAVMSNEIAADFHDINQPDVNAVVALDPANLGDLFAGHDVDFATYSSFSWGFNSSAYGSNAMAKTADESYDVALANPALVESHTGIVDFFAKLVEWNNPSPANDVSRSFKLDRLLKGRATFGNSAGGAFDAVMQGTKIAGAWEPLALQAGAFSASVRPDAGENTIATAKKLPSLVNGWIGAGNRDDYFQIKLKSPATLTIDLTDLSANGDIALVDAAGTPVVLYTNYPGTAPEHMIADLPKGTYYLHVLAPSTSDNTYYTLSVFEAAPRPLAQFGATLSLPSATDVTRADLLDELLVG